MIVRGESFLRIKKLVLTALLGAVLFTGKLALSFIPQVEIVTLSIIAFTYVFGLPIALPATILFVALDTMLYGFAPWVISYLIYWPAISIVTSLMKPLIDKNRVLFAALIAGGMSLLFGVLTSFIDTLFYSDLEKMREFFVAMYIRGIYFYLVHIIANIVIVTLLFEPVYLVLKKSNDRYFSQQKPIAKRKMFPSLIKSKAKPEEIKTGESFMGDKESGEVKTGESFIGDKEWGEIKTGESFKAE